MLRPIPHPVPSGHRRPTGGLSTAAAPSAREPIPLPSYRSSRSPCCGLSGRLWSKDRRRPFPRTPVLRPGAATRDRQCLRSRKWRKIPFRQPCGMRRSGRCPPDPSARRSGQVRPGQTLVPPVRTPVARRLAPCPLSVSSLCHRSHPGLLYVDVKVTSYDGRCGQFVCQLTIVAIVASLSRGACRAPCVQLAHPTLHALESAVRRRWRC